VRVPKREVECDRVNKRKGEHGRGRQVECKRERKRDGENIGEQAEDRSCTSKRARRSMTITVVVFH
jgi:hypothetical protein